MSRFKDIAGQKFGRLLVLRLSKKDEKGYWWKCQCDCGQIVEKRGELMRDGRTRSCGCLQTEVRRKGKHNMYGTPEYRSWQGAKARCQDPNNKRFFRYGGRGIEFRFESFEQFYAELGDRPKGLTLDRKNNDGHYEPGNVRWATQTEQQSNKSNNHLLTVNGETRTLTEWVSISGISRRTFEQRLAGGWCNECTVFMPVQVRGHKGCPHVRKVLRAMDLLEEK